MDIRASFCGVSVRVGFVPASDFNRRYDIIHSKMEWLWQAIVAHWVIVLLGLLGAVLLGALRYVNERWAVVALYGMRAFILILFIAVGFEAIDWFHENTGREIVTPENVEENIRVWLDHFGLSSVKQDAQDSHFTLRITTKEGRPLGVMRPIRFERYVFVVANLTLSPRHKELFRKLPLDRAIRIVRDLRLEIARLAIGYTINAKTEKTVVTELIVNLEKRLPITENLNEDVFVNGVNEVEAALTLADEAITSSLEDYEFNNQISQAPRITSTP